MMRRGKRAGACNAGEIRILFEPSEYVTSVVLLFARLRGITEAENQTAYINHHARAYDINERIRKKKAVYDALRR